MKLKWKYIKPLESEEQIEIFEKKTGYIFPDSYKQCVIENNGGRPNLRVFDTEKCERCLNSFLSFNRTDIETIWDIVEAYESNINFAKQIGDFEESTRLTNLFNRYVVFADSPGGDDIAFDKTNDSVVYIDHETLEVEKIADSFDAFLDCLYD